MENESFSWNVWLYRCALAACVLTALVFGLLQTKAHFDDAYITYRYALNLTRGNGFVYNPGEAVLGTTASLYGLLLAAFHLGGVDIPLASHLIGVLGWCACIILVERIGRTTHHRIVGLAAAALIATSPMFLRVIGMETNLMLALALGGVCLYLAGRPNWAFLLVALATWTRPDCALVALVLGVSYIWERRALPWRGTLIFVAVLLPWLIFTQLFYGSVLPNSLFAKSGQVHSLLVDSQYDTFGWGLVRLASSLYSINKLYLIVGLLGLVGLWAVAQSRPRWMMILAWAGLYIASYIGLAVTAFYWYFLPVLPAAALLIAAGIDQFTHLLSRSRTLARFTPVGWALLGLVLIPQINALWLSRSATPPFSYHSYVQVADWLRANTPPDASVATIEIGIIGYYSDRRIVDTMGLVSPDMLGHLYGWNETLFYALGHFWPDYVVAPKGTAWDYVASVAWFGEAYAPVAKIPSPGPGARTVNIYKRAAEFPIRSFEWARAYDLSAGRTLRLSDIRIQKVQLQPGGKLHVQLEWRALQSNHYDGRVQIDLVNAQSGRRWALANERPMRGGNPTFLWRPGERVLDDYALSLPIDLAQGAYVLNVSLLDVTREGWIEFADSQGKPIAHVVAGPLWVGESAPAFQVGTPAPATFDGIELVGFDLPRSTFAAGEPVPLVLYWKANRPVETDYTVFAHLWDSQGRLIAQKDSPPVQGNLPMSFWVPGVMVQDRYEIMLPPNPPAGSYRIMIGLYQPESGERLLPQSFGGQVIDRALQLATITLH